MVIFIIILLVLILNLIYQISGIYSVIAILVWIVNLFVATLLLIQNPDNIWIRILQIIAIINIFIILIINIDLLNNIYKLGYILPFSVNKITYLDEYFDKSQTHIFYARNSKYIKFIYLDSKEIKDFLINLEDDKVYVVTFDLIFSWITYDYGSNPFIILSKPILVTNQSNPLLISNFIHKRIITVSEIYSLDQDFIVNWHKYGELTDGPIVVLKYSQINVY